MIKNVKLYLVLILVTMVMVACATSQTKQKKTDNAKVFGSDVKVVIDIRDTAIEGPDYDRRSYYRVYINKVEVGRTEIGLESQNKRFETTLEPNKHLLTIEKFILNSKTNRYQKVNNIEQPKPSYTYFNTRQSNAVMIEVEHDVQTHETRYIVKKR